MKVQTPFAQADARETLVATAGVRTKQNRGLHDSEKEGFFVTLPPAAFMRMQMELLRPQVLIQQCELVKRAGPHAFAREFNLPIYEHEAQMWD